MNKLALALIIILGLLITGIFGSIYTGFIVLGDPFSYRVEDVTAATGTVFMKNSQGIPAHLGTTFLVDNDGYFLTANHVIDAITTINSTETIYIQIKTPLGELADFKVIPLANEPLKRKDVALLKAEKFDLAIKPLKIARKEEVHIGGEIGFIGFTLIDPLNPKPDFYVGKGIISNTGITHQSEIIYTISGQATHGYSGASVFLSRNGKVIGLITGGTNDETGKTGIVFVPPIHDVIDIIAKLKDSQ